MNSINLRHPDPEHDFGHMAELLTENQDEGTSESELLVDYQKNKEAAVYIQVSTDAQGQFTGFCWAWKQSVDPICCRFHLMVRPQSQGQGIGNTLYQGMLQACRVACLTTLRVSILDAFHSSRAFAERRGFSELRHSIGMELKLDAFDDRPYDAILASLEAQGFQFTNMQELGNTSEAQRKLFELNDTASASTPGTDGEHAWASFEDFQKSVCLSSWYQPAGQIVAIDTANGTWAAMSAITRFEKADHAYNLFTGVDEAYRGRKLGQAVKVLALRHARRTLGTNLVRTHHNTKNLPMIAIDRKFGYTTLPGTWLMQKTGI